MRVLLIGRYEMLLKALRRGLEEEGFAVDVARDDREGDAKIGTAVYDLLVLDLYHPREADLPLVKRWRRAGLQTPALVLTPPNANGDPSHGPNAGADGWLTKPFELEELLVRLRALTGASGRGRNPDSEMHRATCCVSTTTSFKF